MDEAYTVSFNVDDEEQLVAAKEHFETNGYVVFDGIYSCEECEVTRVAMWEMVEASNRGFNHEDPHTWGAFRTAGYTF